MKDSGLLCANVAFAGVAAVKSKILVAFVEADWLLNMKGSF